MNNAPVKSKLTTKGNIPTKLASVGVDASELFHYTLAIGGDEVDVSTLAEQIADTVVGAVLATYDSETWEAVNGAGYVENWKAQIIADVTEVATGTAVQGRAFKATVCDNVEGCTMEHFKADGKATAKVSKEDNPFLK